MVTSRWDHQARTLMQYVWQGHYLGSDQAELYLSLSGLSCITRSCKRAQRLGKFSPQMVLAGLHRCHSLDTRLPSCLSAKLFACGPAFHMRFPSLRRSRGRKLSTCLSLWGRVGTGMARNPSYFMNNHGLNWPMDFSLTAVQNQKNRYLPSYPSDRRIC